MRVGIIGSSEDEIMPFIDKVLNKKLEYQDVDEGILTEYHPWMKSIYFQGDIKLLELC